MCSDSHTEGFSPYVPDVFAVTNSEMESCDMDPLIRNFLDAERENRECSQAAKKVGMQNSKCLADKHGKFVRTSQLNGYRKDMFKEVFVQCFFICVNTQHFRDTGEKGECMKPCDETLVGHTLLMI